MQVRAADVKDISNRIINNFALTSSEQNSIDEKVVICSDDLAPSETVSLDKNKVLAFVTAYGSSNSHTAILARNMNIPAVIGVGDEFLPHIENGETIIVDGFTGEIYVDPDEAVLNAMMKKQSEDIEKKKLLLNLKGKENITQSGQKIDVCANIGTREDIENVILSLIHI